MRYGTGQHFCRACHADMENENGLIDHMDSHRNCGFICQLCKVGDINKDRHGEGICEKVSNIKMKKLSKQEKKKKKEEVKNASGYLVE